MAKFDQNIIEIDHNENGKGEEEMDIEALVSFYLDGDGPVYTEFERSLLYDNLWENQTDDFVVSNVGDEDIGMEIFSNGDCDCTSDDEMANTVAQLMPVACGYSDLGTLLQRNCIQRCLVMNDNDVLILDSYNVPDLVKFDPESLVSFNFDGNSEVDVVLNTRESVNLMVGRRLRFKLSNGYG